MKKEFSYLPDIPFHYQLVFIYLIVVFSGTNTLQAFNGLFPISYGARQAGMGVQSVLLEYNDRRIHSNPDYAFVNQIEERPRAFFPYVEYQDIWIGRIGIQWDWHTTKADGC